MAHFVFGMNQSLDGYVDHTAFGPSLALFRHFIAQVSGQAGLVYGRGLYEVMRYWDDELLIGTTMSGHSRWRGGGGRNTWCRGRCVRWGRMRR